MSIDPNSCFIDLSDSLNSLHSVNSMKVLLHLGNTPLKSVVTFMSFLGTYVKLEATCEEAMKSTKNEYAFHG